MAYSIDLRKRVLDFIENGGSKVEVSKLFNISRDIICKWHNASDPLVPQKTGPRCIDYKALTQHVKYFPDQTINERASHFGVSRYCIWYGLRKLGFSAKKKTLGYFDGCCGERFNKSLECELCPHLGADHLVIMDNARIHRTQRTKELIEALRASLLYLPPYSPDYNPIKHDFANIKRLREYNKDKSLEDIINMYK